MSLGISYFGEGFVQEYLGNEMAELCKVERVK